MSEALSCRAKPDPSSISEGAIADSSEASPPLIRSTAGVALPVADPCVTKLVSCCPTCSALKLSDLVSAPIGVQVSGPDPEGLTSQRKLRRGS